MAIDQLSSPVIYVRYCLEIFYSVSTSKIGLRTPVDYINKMLRNRWFVLLFALLLVGAGCLVFLWQRSLMLAEPIPFGFTKEEQEAFLRSPSFTRYGGNEFNRVFFQGAYNFKQKIAKYKKQSRSPRVLPYQTSSATPLYIAHKENKNSFGILYFFAKNPFSLVGYNISEAKEVFRLRLPEGYSYSTPIVLTKLSRIYGIFETLINKQKKYHVFSASLEGNDLEVQEIQPYKFLTNKFAPVSSAINEHLHCKTALGYNSVHRYIFWGCSRLGHSSVQKGVRGFLAKMNLDASGKLLPKTFAFFDPAKPSKDPRTGWDNGIWNTGGKSAVLPDGDLVVSIGNGPFIPDKKNYGCSVIVLTVEKG